MSQRRSAIILLALSSSALAAAPAFAEQAADTAAPAAAAPQAEGGIEDIVVTATRRDERLQSVPISVTAIGGAMLAKSGINTTRDLTYTVPGLNFRVTNANAQPKIRGVGTANTGGGDESSVAIYIDGIYQVAPRAALFDLLNIERIEVLRGPQGTLFGRNATGGLVNIITTQPTHDATFRATARYGRFNERSLSAYGSAGLSDVLAVDLAGQIYRDDGYYRDMRTGKHVYGKRSDTLRGRILLDPTDNLEIKTTFAYMKWTDPTTAYMGVLNGNTAARSLANDPRTLIPTKPYETASTVPQNIAVRTVSLANEIKLDLGPVTVLNTVAYERGSSDAILDTDATPFDAGAVISLGIAKNRQQGQKFGAHTFQTESRIMSNGGGALSYIAGFHYLNGTATNGKINNKPKFSSPLSATVLIDGEQKTKAIAGFGEATWAFAEDWKLIGGVRYTHEKREFSGITTRNAVVISQINDAKASFGKVTYRGIIQRDFDGFGNIYASYSRGFKSGVFNIFNTAPTSAATKPEVLDAIEVGVKSDPLPWLRVNLSAFHYDYKNIQLSSRDPGTGLTVLFNAASAKMKGGEYEITVAPTRNLNLRAYGSYIDATYSSFPAAQVLTPILQNQTSIGGSATTPIGNAASIRDVSGSRITRTPKYTIGVSADYTIETSTGDFGIAGNAFRSGKYFWDVQNRLASPAYTIVNGEISWTSPDKVWRAAIWGRNLTNKVIQAQVVPSATADAVTYEKPRTIGVSLGINL